MLKYIANSEHYAEVLEKSLKVKKSLWIGTADIKDLHIKSGIRDTQPYLAGLSQLIRNNIEVRLLFAKQPGQNFKNDFDKYPYLVKYLEKAICLRVHFKIFVFDWKEVYIGSANLTGAGLGMKSENKRNFEAGILTDDEEIVSPAVHQFDEVWMGKYCNHCQRKDFCEIPINKLF
ncbi:MAG: phospholipase D-like domain-containing protein [Flavobacteriaceae bacterium]|nr:phospholipase D-like domain-containing protein [Flavobacteriaceae bacterium]